MAGEASRRRPGLRHLCRGGRSTRLRPSPSPASTWEKRIRIPAHRAFRRSLREPRSSLSRPGGLPTRARPEATNGHSTDLYTSRQSTPTSIRCWPDRPAAPATSWRRSSCDSFATVYRATWLAPRLCGVTVESALPAITPHLMPPAVDRRTAPQSYWTTAVQAAASLRRRSCCCGYRRLGA